MNKRQFVVVVVVAALAGFAGAHMAMRFSTREAIAAEQPEIAQSIKVRRLNIVDDAGRTLVYLGTEFWGQYQYRSALYLRYRLRDGGRKVENRGCCKV